MSSLSDISHTTRGAISRRFLSVLASSESRTRKKIAHWPLQSSAISYRICCTAGDSSLTTAATAALICGCFVTAEGTYMATELHLEDTVSCSAPIGKWHNPSTWRLGAVALRDNRDHEARSHHRGHRDPLYRTVSRAAAAQSHHRHRSRHHRRTV